MINEIEFEGIQRLMGVLNAKIKKGKPTEKDIQGVILVTLMDIRSRVINIEAMAESRYRDEIKED